MDFAHLLKNVAARVRRRLWRRASSDTFRWQKIIARDTVDIIPYQTTSPVPLKIVAAATVAKRYIARPPAPHYVRTPPELHGLSDQHLKEIAGHLAAPEVHAPDGGVALLKDVSVLESGVVMTADGQVVGESLANTQDWLQLGPITRTARRAAPAMAMPDPARHRRLSTELHVLLKQTYDSNYGHWLIEGLPRISIAADYFDLSRCKVIVSDAGDAMRAVYRDSLGAFGIRPDQIVEVGWEEVHVDQLIYPLPMAEHQWKKSPRSIEILETIPKRLGVVGPAPERIYISRNSYTKRRLLNEAEIVEICRANAIEIVYPETLTFSEQVRLFSAAKIVIGNCGANLTNIVFAPRGCTLFSLATADMADGFFWDLADVKGGRYISLHGEAVEESTFVYNESSVTQFDAGLANFLKKMDRDFVIEPDRFAEILERVLSDEPIRGRA